MADWEGGGGGRTHAVLHLKVSVNGQKLDFSGANISSMNHQHKDHYHISRNNDCLHKISMKLLIFQHFIPGYTFLQISFIRGVIQGYQPRSTMISIVRAKKSRIFPQFIFPNRRFSMTSEYLLLTEQVYYFLDHQEQHKFQPDDQHVEKVLPDPNLPRGLLINWSDGETCRCSSSCVYPSRN